jgi:hypothetical protein
MQRRVLVSRKAFTLSRTARRHCHHRLTDVAAACRPVQRAREAANRIALRQQPDASSRWRSIVYHTRPRSLPDVREPYPGQFYI